MEKSAKIKMALGEDVRFDEYGFPPKKHVLTVRKQKVGSRGKSD